MNESKFEGDPRKADREARTETEANMETDRQPQIRDLGPIADLGIELTPEVRKLVWSGTIGPDSRREAEPDLDELVEQLFSDPQETIEPYFGPCDEDAQEQCVDGRGAEGFDPSDPSTHKNGPKSPGGMPISAVGHKLVEDPENALGRTIVDDAKSMLETYEETEMLFGAHTDEQEADNVTGCGALDKLWQMLLRLSQPEANPQLRFFAMTMLGKEDYTSDRFHLMTGRLVSLQANRDEYLLKNPKTGEFDFNKALIQLVRKARPDKQTVEKLLGKHNEVGLAINFVPGTTFYRDQFSYDHDGRLQLFEYDFWRAVAVAHARYPTNDDLSLEHQREIVEKRSQAILFRAIHAVATAMVLTDGSVRLLIRK